MRERAQALRSDLDFLRAAARVAAELADGEGEDEQHREMMSLHGVNLVQPCSNLKKLVRGIVVVTCTSSGMWSEVKRVREDSEVLGKASTQAKLKKARSILSKVGEERLLVQANYRSRRGSSMRAKVSITWLKAFASDCRKEELFLSEGKQRRLKSPRTSQGAWSGCAMERSSSKKVCLRARVEGA